MVDHFEQHCNGFTRRVTSIIPFVPLDGGELEEAACMQLEIKRRKIWREWNQAFGWTDDALEFVVGEGNFEESTSPFLPASMRCD